MGVERCAKRGAHFACPAGPFISKFEYLAYRRRCCEAQGAAGDWTF